MELDAWMDNLDGVCESLQASSVFKKLHMIPLLREGSLCCTLLLTLQFCSDEAKELGYLQHGREE